MNPTNALLLAIATLTLTAGCDGTSRSGNNLTCNSGSCSATCDDVGTAMGCNVRCESGTTCDARCNPGQACNFECVPGATCRFDCTAGSCQATGDADCSCSGDCVGTCGGGVTGPMEDGGTGGSCADLCGAPTDPGYAACVAAC